MKNKNVSKMFFSIAGLAVFVSIGSFAFTSHVLAVSDLSSVSSEQAAVELVNQVLSSADKSEQSADEKKEPGSVITKDSAVASVSVESIREASPVEQVTRPVMTESLSRVDTMMFPDPYIIKAADLTADRNPKISGTVDSSLVIEKVESIKIDQKQSSLLLSGKARPGAVIMVYIFSSNPTVITLSADVDGNWSYELIKSLDDGQHEAYIAIADLEGKIVSKGEPIAFVKTAEAATMIPMSQLKENQSPMEKSSSQYILIAIAIMSVFLMIALALIGVITHKSNFDETAN